MIFSAQEAMKMAEHRYIWLAGGCFWGMEKLMRSVPGVTDAVSGYANGTGEADANYETVCSGLTGFRETVRVEYDPDAVTLDALLFTYYGAIDPGAENRQGADWGSQYQAGIYYDRQSDLESIERVTGVIKARAEKFCVEIKPLENFFPAEEYHQRYLDKHPGGYCHIPPYKLAAAASSAVDPGRYPLPPEEELRKKLSPAQYMVTQRAATEPPFSSPMWRGGERGIYVDAATGEPLFSSKDKFDSPCGWPAFSRPVEGPVIVERYDGTYEMDGTFRTEVRSRAGNSHLGHVFRDEPGTPDGTRYCINGAALRFVAYEDMEKEGYGYLMDKV
jgi:peptide methionine sulfoxide reductase msrA/msrB